MSSGPSSLNDNSNNKRQKTTHTTHPSSTVMQTSIAQPPDELVAPIFTNPTGNVGPLDAAITKMHRSKY
jgi:hypothetical protein